MENDRDTPDSEGAGTQPRPLSEVEEQFGHEAGADGHFEDPFGDEGDLADAWAVEAHEGGGAHTALPPKVEAWRRRSAAGAILTGFALGLQEALEKRKEEPSIVMETSGDPPRDLPVEADFEYGRPRQSVVQIRPWLLPDGSGEAGASSGAEGTGEPDGRERSPGDEGGRA